MSKKRRAEKQPDHRHRKRQLNDPGTEDWTRDEVTATVYDNRTNDDRDVSAFQYHNRRDKYKGVRSEIYYSIEGTEDEDEARWSSEEEPRGRSRWRVDRTVVPRDKTEKKARKADRVQEYIAESNVGKGKVSHCKLDTYFLPFTR